MDVRMIVFDLDGTLLRSDKSVSEYSLSVIEECRKREIRIAVATARSEKAADKYIGGLHYDVMISNGGACVRCGGDIVSKWMLPAFEANRIISDALEHPLFQSITAETESGYYVAPELKPSPTYVQGIPQNFADPLQEDVYKITVKFSNASAAQEIAERHPRCRVVGFSGEDWYRFAHQDANKMNAVKTAAEYTGIELKAIAAFGDDFNDIDMLRGCGIGIAMGNAAKEVKEAADAVCGTNDRDGAARWIEENIL